MLQARTIFELVFISAKVLCQLFAGSAEVFLRFSFGRRYVGALVASFLFCLFYTIAVHTVAPATTSPLLWLHLLAFLTLLCHRLVSTFITRSASVHSYSTGQSSNFWQHFTTNITTAQLLLEPCSFVLVGLLIFPLDAPLSFWLQTSAFALFLKGCALRWNERRRLLDAFDARIEGEQMSEAVQEQFARRSTGVHTVRSAVAAQSPRQSPNTVTHILRNLDPALRGLLSPGHPMHSSAAGVASQSRRPFPRPRQGSSPRNASGRPERRK
jgi:hypothetical protein